MARHSLALRRLVSSFQSVVSTVFSRGATMHSALVPVRQVRKNLHCFFDLCLMLFFQSIWLPSSNTWQPRFLSLRVMQLVITRSNVLCPVISNLPSETMKSPSCPSSHFRSAADAVIRLNKLLGDVVISQGGVVPYISPELLPGKSGKGKKEAEA